ncbi:MAG: alanine/ornithine racemase family PLP-dependent enzyme [Fastidiosipila sp.]|nr:alanine/ornithine racemase family PLP-dependent enzyme [Fastidiosipila sp.]
MHYPQILIDRIKLKHNLKWLLENAEKAGVQIHFITKCFCAHRQIAEEMAMAGVENFGDSRWQNLRKIHDLGKSHMMVRIPMLCEVSEVVRYADLSLNSEIATLEALSDAALSQEKIHGVILMVEMGDLREGFLPEEIETAAERTLSLRGLWLAGIGANFNCYGGVIPEEKQMEQLVQLADYLRSRFNIELPLVSGGNSGALYMMESGKLPQGINHLRIGEAYILGRETSYGNRVGDLYTDVFTLRAQIIECRNKQSVPVGKLGVNAFGEQPTFEDKGMMKRAILGIGRQDTSCETLTPLDRNVDFLGASSDHMICDITHYVNDLELGDTLDFAFDYGALTRAFISPYVEKRLI